MSDWHSLIENYEPLFGYDDDIERYLKDGKYTRSMDWDEGHFADMKENCARISKLYPNIVFKGIVHEYSDGSDTFWEIIFSDKDGIIYEGRHHNIDFSCYPIDIEIENGRIKGYTEIKRE